MDEYIKREEVLKIIADNCPHDKGGDNTEEEIGAGWACCYIRKGVENIPTADVAPRAEVAREIFEEIEKIIKNPFAVGFCMTAPSFRQAISDYNEGIRKEILYYIAKLKEKYTDAEPPKENP